MACSSCGSKGTAPDGTTKVSGCGSNGGCATGGCNRFNVYDWLSDLPFSAQQDGFKVVEVSFKNGSRKGFYRNVNNTDCNTGDLIVVEAATGGYDVGRVSLSGELVRLQMKKKHVSPREELPRIIRVALDKDLERWQEAQQLEYSTLLLARVISRDLALNMKISDVEYQGDGRKATFYYTADDRIDFRELIKVFAREFKIKVEMRQIGARQEAGRIGGIGACGRELCCSTWITDFKSVSTVAARYQNLAINQAKLSGQCGRLKCCLNYELDTYLDTLKDFPQHAETLEMQGGIARLVKTDIFKKLLWYTVPGPNAGIHPLSVSRVKEIQELNRQGIRPDDINSQTVREDRRGSSRTKDEMAFSDGVGEAKLEDFGIKEKKRKRKNKDSNKDREHERASSDKDNVDKGKNPSSEKLQVRKRLSLQTGKSEQTTGASGATPKKPLTNQRTNNAPKNSTDKPPQQQQQRPKKQAPHPNNNPEKDKQKERPTMNQNENRDDKPKP